MKPAEMFGEAEKNSTGALIVASLIFLKFVALILQNKIIQLEDKMKPITQSFKSTILTFLVSMLEVTWAVGASVFARYSAGLMVLS